MSTRKKSKGKLSEEKLRKVMELIFSDDNYVSMAIYGIVVASQELYFGEGAERGLNVIEKVKIPTNGGEMVKSYFSGTKQRGIERRAIAYSIVKGKDGEEPYYRYFGLTIDISDSKYKDLVPDPRDILTYMWGATWTNPPAFIRGRVSYGGGVSIQAEPFDIKTRNRVEYRHYDVLKKENKESTEEEKTETGQMVWYKEYVQPYTLFPVVRHGFLLGVNNMEPHALAYAFLQMLVMAGAGTPKGMTIFEGKWLEEDKIEPVLVVDVYKGLAPEPVIIPPHVTSIGEALRIFKEKTESYGGILKELPDKHEEIFNKTRKRPIRLVGKSAYDFLRKLAEEFSREYLMKIEELKIPRVTKAKRLGILTGESNE